MSADVDDEEQQEECKAGSPAWVMTFADLMSLLMCFFVLLLSFAEIDAMKFKRLAGELQRAFGVQRQIRADDVPMGTSPIFHNYTPGKPEPNPMEIIQQQTTRYEQNLTTESTNELPLEQTKQDAENIAKALQDSIEDGRVQVELDRRNIIIRVEEKGSFASGSATLNESFIDVMDKIRFALMNTPGTITIEGHSDDVPISTDRFSSNWDLSAARAASVANELLVSGDITPERVKVIGYAETKPRVANDSADNRAMNRRVEIVVNQSNAESRGAIDQLEQQILPDGVQIREEPEFQLRPNEIF
ncbi:chemotaxis protein MotB [Allopseudospirillum japonicum]|uniref:Chemotaxis protein MotB n=1 Tax=Allopseudospirillum japonicum TaxID=64971 RepID=A0A1H6UPX0_9GAMM|nr:flagellar motor protein MotB [Allopseudospirillum japonicum]SEI90095.1 chemotaxis protein MotB [Allopseudospirillum japonicum]